MITAVDSSVLLDVVAGDPDHADTSKRALRDASSEGALVIGECVLAEITPAFHAKDISEFLSDWQLSFVASSRESALLAGEMFALHLKQGGKRRRVLRDFLIGAHAQCHADRLLARDGGYLRDYFGRLTVLSPT